MEQLSIIGDNKQITKDIFANIRQIRNERKLTQREVALRLNICLFSYSRMESGVVNIKISRLEQIAGIFELTVGQLINWNRPDQSSTQLNDLHAKTERYETEILNLRRTVIRLSEELHFINSGRQLA